MTSIGMEVIFTGGYAEFEGYVCILQFSVVPVSITNDTYLNEDCRLIVTSFRKPLITAEIVILFIIFNLITYSNRHNARSNNHSVQCKDYIQNSVDVVSYLWLKT